MQPRPSAPEDLVRELLYQAVGSRAQRVEVVLEAHGLEGAAREGVVVLEVRVSHDGYGLSETAIEERVVAVPAGAEAPAPVGLGSGIAAVLAWDPDAVVLRTGRDGRAWELVFGADRRFTRAQLAGEFDGTSVSVFKRVREAELGATVQSLQDALARSVVDAECEVVLESRASGEAPCHIGADRDGEAGWFVDHEDGWVQVRVAYGAPGGATRAHGGIRSWSGELAQLAPGLARELAGEAEHLRVEVDARTVLDRDGVARFVPPDDPRVARYVLAAAGQLRERLGRALERAVEHPEPWDEAHHAYVGWLWAHAAVVVGSGVDWSRRRILRSAASEGVAVSAAEIAGRRSGSIALFARVEAPRSPVLPDAAAAGIPVLRGRARDLPALAALVGPQGVRLLDAAEGVAVDRGDEAAAWAPIASLLQRLDPRLGGVEAVRARREAPSSPEGPVGVIIGGSLSWWFDLGSEGGGAVPRGERLGIRLDHPAVAAVLELDDRSVACGLALLVGHALGLQLDADRLVRVVDEVLQEATA